MRPCSRRTQAAASEDRPGPSGGRAISVMEGCCPGTIEQAFRVNQVAYTNGIKLRNAATVEKRHGSLRHWFLRQFR